VGRYAALSPQRSAPPAEPPQPAAALQARTFMMLPLCTMVRLRRFWSSAYWMAERTSRSVPSREMGLMPKAEESGKRIFLLSFLALSHSKSSFASAEPASNSMPA